MSDLRDSPYDISNQIFRYKGVTVKVIRRHSNLNHVWVTTLVDRNTSLDHERMYSHTIGGVNNQRYKAPILALLSELEKL
jgi:hypothetical protein